MYYIFTDGGCSNNGKKNAVASFSCIIIDGKTRKIIRGKVLPNEFFLENGTIVTENGNGAIVSEITKIIEIKSNEKYVQPSNNRGELLGIIQALKYLTNLQPNATNVIIVSDSLLCIKTFNEWLPARRKKNTAHELKNFDLISIGEILLEECKKLNFNIKFVHINSHLSEPVNSNLNNNLKEYNEKHFLWKGNKLADEHCSIAIKNNHYDVEFI